MKQEKQQKAKQKPLIKLEIIPPKIEEIDDGDVEQEDDDDEVRREKKKRRLAELKKIALNFIRIRDDYYKIVHRPDRSGKKYKFLLRLAKSTITDDYTKSILQYIKKYDDFCLVASHVDYRQDFNGFYNQYHEITHQLIEGKCDTILHIIRHIFGEKHFDFALDYLQLLYIDPNQRLPILVIESEAKNTGKSTFGILLYLIFQDNAIKIGNNDLQSDFNAFWVQRLIIIIDEASLNKKDASQMVKRFSTETGKVTSNEKNKAQQEVDFFGKFIFFSNDEGKAINVERGDPRWAVFKVPTFAEKGYKDDPNIESKIAKEIPAFLHFLLNRKLKHSTEKASRMYFAPEVYRTSQLMLYYENSISKIGIAIKQMVKDTFLFFPDEVELRFSLNNIMYELKDEVRFLVKEDVRFAIEKEFGIQPNKKNNYTYFSLKLANKNQFKITKNSGGNNITYSFLKETCQL